MAVQWTCMRHNGIGAVATSGATLAHPLASITEESCLYVAHTSSTNWTRWHLIELQSNEVAYCFFNTAPHRSAESCTFSYTKQQLSCVLLSARRCAAAQILPFSNACVSHVCMSRS